MDRVFLDANVLFSASYSAVNRLLDLWKLDNVELIASGLAVHEALSNLPSEDQRERLQNLLAKIKIVPEPTADSVLPTSVSLPSKDIPILLSAIDARASHLLTGDKRHFGPLFGPAIAGVMIERPSVYLVRQSG